MFADGSHPGSGEEGCWESSEGHCSVASGQNGAQSYHCVDLFCVRCCTSCSAKIMSCHPHNHPKLGHIIAIPSLLMKPP